MLPQARLCHFGWRPGGTIFEHLKTLARWRFEVKAVLQSHVVAESDDIVESGGYHSLSAFVGPHAVADEGP